MCDVIIANMKKFLRFFIALFLPCQICAADFTTSAKSAFLVDFDSGTEIVSKNADSLMPPSSMLKLMTLAVTFDAIKSKELNINDKLVVGKNADYRQEKWQSASKICLIEGQSISVSDAIHGIIVQSGGDASVVLAERLAGTEQDFAKKMTARAREIGMKKSSFGNATGLPDDDNLMTSKELATLANYLLTTHADLYPMFATKRFEFPDYKTDWCREWGRTKTLNYNKLLFMMNGADGLKTGHTSDGGYGMVASAKVRGRRLIAVLNGFKGKGHEALGAEVKKLLEYGFKTTQTKVFFEPGDKIIEIPVWYGKDKTVTATVEKNFAITLASDAETGNIRLLARFEEPIPAPIKSGEIIGEIIAQQNGKVLGKANLVAAERVRKVWFFGRLSNNVKNILVKIGL